MDPTISEHAGGGELDVGQGPEVIEHGTAVALFLRVIHKGADVVFLAVVSDAWADNHGDVRCKQRQENLTVSHLLRTRLICPVSECKCDICF